MHFLTSGCCRGTGRIWCRLPVSFAWALPARPSTASAVMRSAAKALLLLLRSHISLIPVCWLIDQKKPFGASAACIRARAEGRRCPRRRGSSWRKCARVKALLRGERARQRVEGEHVGFPAARGRADFIAPFAEAVGAHDRALGQRPGFDLFEARDQGRPRPSRTKSFPSTGCTFITKRISSAAARRHPAPVKRRPAALAVAGVGGGKATEAPSEAEAIAGLCRVMSATVASATCLGARRLLARALGLGDAAAVLAPWPCPARRRCLDAGAEPLVGVPCLGSLA